MATSESRNHWDRALIDARFLVASLGETATPPWWRSEATSPVGLRMLERLFPRTAATACLQTASQAVQLEHDARIGRSGVYHLFRLPSTDETALRDLLGQPETEVRIRELAEVDRDEKLRTLSDMAAPYVLKASEGPAHCGTAGELRDGNALAHVCAAYVAGFRSNQAVYPYLTEEPA